MPTPPRASKMGGSERDSAGPCTNARAPSPHECGPESAAAPDDEPDVTNSAPGGGPSYASGAGLGAAGAFTRWGAEYMSSAFAFALGVDGLGAAGACDAGGASVLTRRTDERWATRRKRTCCVVSCRLAFSHTSIRPVQPSFDTLPIRWLTTCDDTFRS